MKSEKQKDAISDLTQTLASVIWWVKIGGILIYIYRITTKIVEPLMLIAFLVLMLMGIWSDDLKLLRIAGTILLSGFILAGLAMLFTNIYKMIKKPTSKAKDLNTSDELLMGIVSNRIKADPEYRKKIADISLSVIQKEIFPETKK